MEVVQNMLLFSINSLRLTIINTAEANRDKLDVAHLVRNLRTDLEKISREIKILQDAKLRAAKIHYDSAMTSLSYVDYVSVEKQSKEGDRADLNQRIREDRSYIEAKDDFREAYRNAV